MQHHDEDTYSASSQLATLTSAATASISTRSFSLTQSISSSSVHCRLHQHRVDDKIIRFNFQ